MRIHYMEIVTSDVTAQCVALSRIHAVAFGPEQPALGNARVAEMPDGSLIGVRAPLAEHDQPIVRTYRQVDDIQATVRPATRSCSAWC
jgi:hypothetical protein